MQKPDISVIVPVYNVERYLEECLDSLVGQTHRNIEIICVDDGSKDSSGEILRRYAGEDERVRVISQANSGVAHSRNVALDEAKGTYVLFVDSDDYISLNACELMLARANETNAEIVVFGGKTFPTMHWADASFACNDVVYENDSVQAVLYERGSRPLMCNKLYLRSMLDSHQMRFQENLKLGEDHAFQFVVFPLCKTIAFMKDCLYFYRGRPDSAVASRKDDHGQKARMHFDVVKHVLGEWKERGFLVGHEKEMAEWACSFLYNDLPKADFDMRAVMAADFDGLLKEYFGEGVADILSEPCREQYEVMTDPCRVDSSAPKYSVILYSHDGSEEVKDVLDSVGRQTEPSVEIIALIGDGQDKFASAVRSYACKDRRFVVVEGVSLQEAVLSARGRYILCSSSNVLFEETMLRHLGKMMEPSGEKPLDADVLVLKDADDTLSVRDVFDVFQPDPSKEFRLVSTYSNADLRGRGAELVGLHMSSKVFEASLLKQCAERTAGRGEVSLCAAALESCASMFPTGLPALTVLPLRFENDQDASDFANRLSADLIAAIEHVDPSDPYAEEQRASLALASRFMTLSVLSCLRRRSAFESAFAAFRGRLGEIWVSCAPYAQSRLGSVRSESMASLLDGEVEGAFDLHMAELADKLARLNRTNLLMVGDFAAQSAKLSSDIEEFYGSVSYRVGRAVTLVPRLCANALKRILGR